MSRSDSLNIKTMLHFMTILLLTQTEFKTRGIHAQLIFKRQVIGFDSSGRAKVQNNDNRKDFLNQGIVCSYFNICFLFESDKTETKPSAIELINYQ